MKLACNFFLQCTSSFAVDLLLLFIWTLPCRIKCYRN
uniref:Uncharacterized protein n=1 Tax=Rhizophora mucronata TaxID=61149 RepID=A0A2P2R4J0_RHIMU